MINDSIEIIGQIAVVNIPDTQNEVRQTGEHLNLMIYDAEILPEDCDEKAALEISIRAIESNLNKLKDLLVKD